MVRPVILYIVSCHGDQLFVSHLYTRMTCYKMHIDSLVTSYLLCLDMVTRYMLCLDMVTSFLLCLDMMTSYLLSCHSDQLLVLYLYTAMTCYTMHCDSIVTKYSCLCYWQSLIICSCYQQIWNKFYCVYLACKTVPKFVNRDVPHFDCFNLSFPVLTNQDETTWLIIELLPLSCSCAGHCQLRQALVIIKWGRLILRPVTASYRYY